MIADPTNDVLANAASYLEIAIKMNLGKLKLQLPFDDVLKRCSGEFKWLPIEARHLMAFENLPPPGKHRDPFDRLLIAQAIVENVPIVSCDEAFSDYPVKLVW